MFHIMWLKVKVTGSHKAYVQNVLNNKILNDFQFGELLTKMSRR